MYQIHLSITFRACCIHQHNDVIEDSTIAQDLQINSHYHNRRRICKCVLAISPYSTGARNLKNEIVQHILQKRFDLSRW